MKKHFYTLALLLLFVACKQKEVVEPIDMGYDYFPDKVGSYIIYDVDSLWWDDFTQTHDTAHYQIKELYESVYNDNENKPTIRIERYKRNSLKDAWTITDVWTVRKTKETVEKTEENVRYIKLIFPVKKDKEWDGNSLNYNNAQWYKYTEKGVEKNINQNKYTDCIVILQVDDENQIEKHYAKEIYARNIGLIYKENIEIYGKQTNLNLPLESRIDKGHKIYYKLNTYYLP